MLWVWNPSENEKIFTSCKPRRSLPACSPSADPRAMNFWEKWVDRMMKMLLKLKTHWQFLNLSSFKRRSTQFMRLFVHSKRSFCCQKTENEEEQPLKTQCGVLVLDAMWDISPSGKDLLRSLFLLLRSDLVLLLLRLQLLQVVIHPASQLLRLLFWSISPG